jgi:hypothetical protein
LALVRHPGDVEGPGPGRRRLTRPSAAPESDTGRYAAYWREIDSDVDDIRLAHVRIIEGYSTLADTAKIIAIRHLPIGRMNAERVVIIATVKIEDGDARCPRPVPSAATTGSPFSPVWPAAPARTSR